MTILRNARSAVLLLAAICVLSTGCANKTGKSSADTAQPDGKTQPAAKSPSGKTKAPETTVKLPATTADAVGQLRKRFDMTINVEIQVDDNDDVLELDLTGKKFTDADMILLTPMKKLTYLFLNDTQVTDAGLKHIMELKELQTLNVKGSKVTAAGVGAVQQALPNANVIAD